VKQNTLEKNIKFIEAQILSSQGRHLESKLIYESLLSRNKENHLIYLNLGVTNFLLGDFVGAEKLLKTAISLNKKSFIACHALGNSLASLDRPEEAVLAYDQGIAIESSYPDLYNDRGITEMTLLNFSKARQDFQRAMDLDPKFLDAMTNLGIALSHLNLYKEASQIFEKAITLDSQSYLAHLNLGLTLQFLGRLEESLNCFNRAHQLNPSDEYTNWNKANLLLLMGQYEEGWQLYESRWRSIKKQDVRDFNRPLWLGEESLTSKTIFIHAEQGFGDVIQFSRYIALLQLLDAKVIFEVQPSLINLMKSLQCASLEVIAKGSNIPAFDYQCPIMSLPLAFKTSIKTIPHEMPYLFPTEKKIIEWKEKIKNSLRLKVGIAWSGSKTLFHTHHRSIDLKTFSKIFNDKFDFHVLQKEIDEKDLGLLKNMSNVHLYQEQLSDFSDTAALIYEMDLIITIDTSVAHLAGALAKKTLILLPFVPDCRWLMTGEKNPWYPTTKLFRQTASLDWNEVIEKLVTELQDYLSV
jgi:tetratricopeptide (TPR) repeat protein